MTRDPKLSEGLRHLRLDLVAGFLVATGLLCWVAERYGTYHQVKNSIHGAAHAGNDKVVRWWLENGTDPDEPSPVTVTPTVWRWGVPLYQEKPWYGGCTGGSNQQWGEGQTPLQIAVIQGHCEVVKTLLEAGADPEVYNDYLQPVYFCLGQFCDEQILLLLVEHGADINGRSHSFGSPLHYVATVPVLEQLQTLVKLGAEVDLLDAEGRSPLFHALSMAEYENARYLLAMGADLRRIDHAGNNTLHAALEVFTSNHTAHIEMLRELVAAGVSPQLANKKGQTPIDLLRDFESEIAGCYRDGLMDALTPPKR